MKVCPGIMAPVCLIISGHTLGFRPEILISAGDLHLLHALGLGVSVTDPGK